MCVSFCTVCKSVCAEMKHLAGTIWVSFLMNLQKSLWERIPPKRNDTLPPPLKKNHEYIRSWVQPSLSFNLEAFWGVVVVYFKATEIAQTYIPETNRVPQTPGPTTQVKQGNLFLDCTTFVRKVHSNELRLFQAKAIPLL